MAGSLLLDTSVVIDLFKGRPVAKQVMLIVASRDAHFNEIPGVATLSW